MSHPFDSCQPKNYSQDSAKGGNTLSFPFPLSSWHWNKNYNTMNNSWHLSRACYVPQTVLNVWHSTSSTSHWILITFMRYFLILLRGNWGLERLDLLWISKSNICFYCIFGGFWFAWERENENERMNIESEFFENFKSSPKSYSPFPSMANDFLLPYTFAFAILLWVFWVSALNIRVWIIRLRLGPLC